MQKLETINNVSIESMKERKSTSKKEINQSKKRKSNNNKHNTAKAHDNHKIIKKVG